MNTLLLFGIVMVFAILALVYKRFEARDQWEHDGIPVGALEEGLLSPQEMEQELTRLKGRKVSVIYYRHVPGAEQAADIVRRTLRRFDVKVDDVAGDAEVTVCILNGKRFPYRFTIDRTESSPDPWRIDRECAKDVLIDCVEMGICHYFKKAGSGGQSSPRQSWKIADMPKDEKR